MSTNEKYMASLSFAIEAPSQAEVYRLLARFLEGAALEGASWISTSVSVFDEDEEPTP